MINDVGSVFEMKENKSDENKPEIKKGDNNEEDHLAIYSGQEEFSLQNISYAPRENIYLNEHSNEKNKTNDADTNNHNQEFAEELSDGGERDQFIKNQTNDHCGGL